MPQYFAAVLARREDKWIGDEIELGEIEDLDALVEQVRDRADGGTALLFLEEDDEYLAILRVDGDGDPRAFITDSRAIVTSPLAALVMEDTPVDDAEDDEDEGTRPEAEPAGDADIVKDLGINAKKLLALCAEKGMLPGDVVNAICEKVGCVDILDELRVV